MLVISSLLVKKYVGNILIIIMARKLFLINNKNPALPFQPTKTHVDL